MNRLAISGIIRRVALFGLAGVSAGFLVGGIGGRVAMRVSAVAAGPTAVGRVTDAGNRVGDVTLEGTVALVMFGGVLGGALAAVLIVMSERWLRWMRSARWIGYALVVLAAAGTTIISASNRDFLVLRPQALNVAMFVGLFFLYAIVVQVVWEFADRRLPNAQEEAQPGYLAIAVLGAPFLLLILSSLTVPSFAEGETRYGMAALLGLMTAATAGTWVHEAMDRPPAWLLATSRALGYASLVLLLAFGIPSLISEIRLIL